MNVAFFLVYWQDSLLQLETGQWPFCYAIPTCYTIIMSAVHVITYWQDSLLHPITGLGYLVCYTLFKMQPWKYQTQIL